METTTTVAAQTIKTLCETFPMPEGFSVRVTARQNYLGDNAGQYLVAVQCTNGATKALWSTAWETGKAMRAALRGPEFVGAGTMSRKMQIHWIFDQGFTPRAYGVRLTFVIVPAV